MTMEKNEIVKLFQGHIHCSQVVFSAWADALGLDEEEARRMSAPFGGGAFRGEMCGCVAGALLVLGFMYGHAEEGDEDTDAMQQEKVKAFCDAFIERFGSVVCRELVPFDFSKEGALEEAFASGILFERCPNFVNGALEILDEIIDD